MPLLGQLSPIGNYESGGKSTTVGAMERRVVMKSRGFLWLLAVLIGSALAFSPMISSPVMAQEKKEEKEEKKEEKKKEEKKKGDEKAKKGDEKAKKGDEKAKKGDEKKEEKKM
jgi:mannitol-specific phosphotransferase system IIBC component